MSGCPQCLRWTSFTLNILIFITAALTLGYGTYLLSSQWDIVSTDDHIPIFMFILFAVLLVVSLIGSIATCRLSRCLLMLYAIILAICFILEVVFVILILTSNFNTESWLEDRFTELSQDDRDLLEKELECCGWNENTPDPNCTEYTDYCETKLKDYAEEMKVIGMALAALIIVFEV